MNTATSKLSVSSESYYTVTLPQTSFADGSESGAIHCINLNVNAETMFDFEVDANVTCEQGL